LLTRPDNLTVLQSADKTAFKNYSQFPPFWYKYTKHVNTT